MLDMHLQDPLLLLYSSPVDRWTETLVFSLSEANISRYSVHLRTKESI